MPEFQPQFEDGERKESPGELYEQYASLVKQAFALFLDRHLTNRQTDAFAVVFQVLFDEAAQNGFDARVSPTQMLEMFQQFVERIQSARNSEGS